MVPSYFLGTIPEVGRGSSQGISGTHLQNWRLGSSSRAPSLQAYSPEFKPQFCFKKKRKSHSCPETAPPCASSFLLRYNLLVAGFSLRGGCGWPQAVIALPHQQVSQARGENG